MKCKRGACSVLTLMFLLVAVCAYGAAHDVAIDRVVVDPSNPRINEPFKIEGLASNLGTEDEQDIEVVFSVNGAETGRVDIRQLKTEASKTVHEFHTFTAPGEYRVAVRAVVEDDENPTNDMDQIIVAAVGDDADDGSSDPPPSDDPPADDPPPDDDDGTGDDGGSDDGFLTAYYHVRVANHTGSAIRFDFSLDSRTYDRSLQLAAGASEVSDTLRVSPGAHTCYGRWQDPATGQWQYEQQDKVIFLFENEEFAFSIESVVHRLEGRIVDGGDPVADAGVALLEGGATTVATLRTGGDGRFVFDSLVNGRIYSLRITREGYLDKIRELGRVTTNLNIGDVYLEAVDTGGGDDEPGDDGDDGIGGDTGDDPAAPADSDGDGVIDADDAFPKNPAESVDTDGDGIGDNADTDDDGDGMPDSWEIEHLLNPLVADAAGDPDGDGVTNIDEYAAGTDPGVFEENFPPGIPVLTAPADAAAGLPVALTLETGGFTDPDGDDHAQTRWQIAEHPDFQLSAFDVQSKTFLTRLDVPNLVLPGETTCYWRVRYIDSRGAASPWSETRSFTTRDWAADENRNGIADAVEYTEYSDMDADGVADLDQENIGCVMAVRDHGRVMGVLCPESSGVIECLEVVDYGDIADEAGRPEQMPFDLINFRLRLPQPGESVRLRIYLSEPLEGEAAWYKYNPMTGWVDFSSAATFDGNGQVIEIEIKDGGEGDIDGVANGVIVDPSGVSAGVGSATIGKKSDHDDDDEGGTWYVGCFIRSLLF